MISGCVKSSVSSQKENALPFQGSNLECSKPVKRLQLSTTLCATKTKRRPTTGLGSTLHKTRFVCWVIHCPDHSQKQRSIKHKRAHSNLYCLHCLCTSTHLLFQIQSPLCPSSHVVRPSNPGFSRAAVPHHSQHSLLLSPRWSARGVHPHDSSHHSVLCSPRHQFSSSPLHPPLPPLCHTLPVCRH